LNSPELETLAQFYPAIAIETDLDDNLFNITGSQIHIRKIVMNLVSNAAEAIEAEGRITVSTVNRYVDRPFRGYEDFKEGEYVVMSVADTGPGISRNDRDRIFEPFYTKKIMGRSGTGLGLAVVWNIVQDHKGYIDLISDRNNTTFSLYFPATREEISSAASQRPIQDYKGNAERILIVDDIESQREIASNMLEKLGYSPKTVSTGEEAVEYAKHHEVDLIILDMIMEPGINGRETYERILTFKPGQKAIITSGFAETAEVKKAQRLGAGPYIRKPFTLEQLGLAVKEGLSESRCRR
jgi:CheY-like chemotaxis protein